MPNRTIYVADADLPIFEKAQQLAGGNLSATIAAALRRFVEREEARRAGFEEVTVRVGKAARIYKRFWGRLLARGLSCQPERGCEIMYRIYQTRKGKFAVYIREGPAWSDRRYWSRRTWLGREWACWPQDYDYRLEIYDSREELRRHLPVELYEAVSLAIEADQEEDGPEFLDI
ncbi:EXLDI protein [Thermogemmatispora sp.]|uniref:EXLDI protein n=1 Tax=Thermogemmatispora sp. TaxID=1968838 RepID=UPI001D54ABAC|nr:EXLDI protein [Thermogemmatispora sp.]MBX5450307.1 EXLDI protein [Thermogemmatispora sp.]